MNRQIEETREARARNNRFIEIAQRVKTLIPPGVGYVFVLTEPGKVPVSCFGNLDLDGTHDCIRALLHTHPGDNGNTVPIPPSAQLELFPQRPKPTWENTNGG